MKRIQQPIGRIFHRWTVLTNGVVRNKHRYVTAQCDCGQIREVLFETLRNGTSQSCGCLKQQLQKKHGEGHGNTPEYRAWHSMLQRCRNSKHKRYTDYGGRGITVCSRWLDYSNFLTDMGRCPPGTWIERRDNNKGYTPKNCYWATPKEQGRNRRNTRYLTYNGVTQRLIEWAEQRHINYQTLYARLNNDWPIAKALELS